MTTVWESEPGAAKKIGFILENPNICLCVGCENELTGRQRYCSDKCRKAASRTDNSDKPKSDTEVGQPMTAREICSRKVGFDNVRATLEHYECNPSMYAQRANPEKLNWGPWLDTEQLVLAGFKANRVSIPGDWDFEEAV
ncbi:hypothetical protein LCGC14_1501720 [marine sediment metagenome]|uniref:Uncharacterized protein n=1 Tax=marine sediment metagenome TaxID=412755 RepID=A0A0F9LJL2_9ZZZZ